MTRDNLATVGLGTSQEVARRILHQRRIEKLLVVDDQHHCVGLNHRSRISRRQSLRR
jgi:IMP dehydrogenase